MIPRSFPIYAALLALWLLGVSESLGQTDNAAPSEAPCTGPIYSEFDFWLGTWDVTNADGVLQGRNIITREERGCLIVERWTSESGGTGQSYNFVDPASGLWRQVWVSSAANIDYTGGRTAAGGIRLDGEITYRSGDILPFVGEWIPRPDGTVLQVFHQFNPETNTWDEWFTGIYTRVEDDTDD